MVFKVSYLHLNHLYRSHQLAQSNSHMHIKKFLYIQSTYVHFKSKIFQIASMEREKSGEHNDMAFALKGKALEIVEEKVISTCGCGPYVMR